MVTNKFHTTRISKAMPSCREIIQQNVKGIDLTKSNFAGLCRSAGLLSISAAFYKTLLKTKNGKS